MVVCRMLGLNYASYATQTNFFGGNFGAIVLSGVSCRGDENSLDQCTVEIADSSKCVGKPDQIAGAICSSSKAFHFFFDILFGLNKNDDYSVQLFSYRFARFDN